MENCPVKKLAGHRTLYEGSAGSEADSVVDPAPTVTAHKVEADPPPTEADRVEVLNHLDPTDQVSRKNSECPPEFEHLAKLHPMV